MLRGYIIKSRVREADKLLLAQPYSPALFSQGTLPGPQLLLDVLENKVSPKEAETRWTEIERERTEQKKDMGGKSKLLDEIIIPCRRCDALGVTSPKTGKEFPGSTADQMWKETVSKGQDALCSRCDGVMRNLDMRINMFCEGCQSYSEKNNFWEADQKAWDPATREDCLS